MGNIYAPKWHFKVAIKTVSLLRSPLLLFIVGSPRCNYFFNTHVMMRQFPNGALNPRVKKAMAALVVGFVVVNCQLQLINWQWRRASPFPPHFPANLFFACSFSGIDSSMCSLMRKYQLQYTLSVVFQHRSPIWPPPLFSPFSSFPIFTALFMAVRDRVVVSSN